MRPDQRIVTRLPLEELWTDRGPIAAARSRALDREDIASLLRAGGVRFVVANLGDRLEWITPEHAFEHWKVLRERLVAPETVHENDGEVRFRASVWPDDASEPIIVFEAHH
jgi:hypothetical protein